MEDVKSPVFSYFVLLVCYATKMSSGYILINSNLTCEGITCFSKSAAKWLRDKYYKQEIYSYWNENRFKQETKNYTLKVVTDQSNEID